MFTSYKVSLRHCPTFILLNPSSDGIDQMKRPCFGCLESRYSADPRHQVIFKRSPRRERWEGVPRARLHGRANPHAPAIHQLRLKLRLVAS
jgi:hypothetical protein